MLVVGGNGADSDRFVTFSGRLDDIAEVDVLNVFKYR